MNGEALPFFFKDRLKVLETVSMYYHAFIPCAVRRKPCAVLFNVSLSWKIHHHFLKRSSRDIPALFRVATRPFFSC
jgi:hypothetical protein